MKPLRFCHLTTFYPPHSFGGDAIGVQRLARSLVRRGHEVTVVSDSDAYNTLRRGPEPTVYDGSDGVRVLRLHSQFATLSTLATHQVGRPVVNGRKIARLFAEESFDVINFHNISLLGGPGLLRLGSSVKLYMAHEHWLVCPSHVLWRHDREPCPSRQCVRCVLSYRRPPQVWRYTGAIERSARHIDAFIAMSDFSRDKHREMGFPHTMNVVPYFLPDADPPHAVGKDATLPRPRPYFLFVGRLEKIKGLETVIPVFRDYAGADLLVAGDGEQADTLRAMAAGVPSVKFLGRVPTDDLARYYRHAVALIVPSLGFETFGIIIIEAFRAGTPVIARRIGPFPEIVNLAQGGELFSTSEELVAAMRRLQHDADWRALLAKNAYEGFIKHWSEDAVIPRYVDVVRKAAIRRGDRRVAEALTDQGLDVRPS